ncbi:MAG TPA: transglycosylase SLT domain-containing protein [Bacteroidia bacterium]|nr:transglycosylase SLT domain-containing protein [Bacteroidia bacterium]
MKIPLFICIFLSACTQAAVTSPDTLETKAETGSCERLCDNVVGIVNPLTNCNENYVFDRSLYHLKLDTLAQVRFWRNIMKLHEDSAIVNFANSRGVIQKISIKDWNQKTDSFKKLYRDSVRLVNSFDTTQRVLITTGKKFFYDFDKTSLNFQKGIHCFVENNVDPWFAQAILLIESPNKLQKSNAGAYGSFQLMKDVARLYGLKVNKSIDERADFERSAYAASSLIKTICIPKAHKMLDSLGIRNYSETELWFKLLVMHIYHAGSYNVQSALFTFRPAEGNMDLIYNLWRAQTARFKSASQNYSQLILAAMFEMNDRIEVLKKSEFSN